MAKIEIVPANPDADIEPVAHKDTYALTEKEVDLAAAAITGLREGQVWPHRALLGGIPVVVLSLYFTSPDGTLGAAPIAILPNLEVFETKGLFLQGDGTQPVPESEDPKDVEATDEYINTTFPATQPSPMDIIMGMFSGGNTVSDLDPETGVETPHVPEGHETIITAAGEVLDGGTTEEG